MSDIHQLSVAQLRNKLDQKELSSTEITQHFLERIERHDSEINSFITVSPELALQQAKQADELIARNEASALTGIPIAHKDIFCTDGLRTTCGSKMLDNFVPTYESTVTQRLAEAGMITLGKLNMDEFAMGSSNETSYYGPVRNPWDLNRTPGGSSGGSAASVAARLAPVATGTDTGGSIRQPAAHCGLTGIKPTYGTVSRWGMIAFASSLDQAGVISHSAEDAALVLQAMMARDPKDSTSITHPNTQLTQQLTRDVKGLTIGVPESFFDASLNADIALAIRAAITELEQQGAIIKPISLDLNQHAIACYYVIAPSEASANLSRFDGLRYGYRCANPTDLSDLYTRSRTEAFGDEVKRRILVGTYALSSGYYDAYYKKAQQVRRLIRDDFYRAFQDVDLIMCPTTPSTAFNLGEKTDDPQLMYLEDMYTLAINLAGLPALSMPCGFSQNLPIGAQLIGPTFSEARLLNVAHQYQQATEHHKHTPSQYSEA